MIIRRLSSISDKLPARFPYWSLVVIISVVLLSCEIISAPNTSLQDTLTVMGMQSTMIAEGTRIAAQFETTSQAQQMTELALQSLQLPSSVPTTEAPLPTVATQPPVATSTPTQPAQIKITDWENIGWTFIKSNVCKRPSEGCWAGLNYKIIATLTTKESIYIDPNWISPYLVYWHLVDTDEPMVFGSVQIIADDETYWLFIATVGSTNDAWVKEFFDLAEYKGRSITIRFYTEPTKVDVLFGKSFSSKHFWYLQDIMIVPTFKGP